MSKRLYAVIGLGRFGSAVASTLIALGQEVIGVDDDEDRVREMGELTTNALQIDATDIRALRQAGVGEADVAIISIGENIEASLLIVMQVKDLGVQTIIAKAASPLHGRILEKLGVSRVIFPEREMAERTARSLVIPNALDYISLSREFSLVEVGVPASFIGHTLRSIDLRARHGLTLVAIKRQVGGKEETVVSPQADEVLREGDVLALLGSNEKLALIEAIR
ncbi:potassium transporter Trk [Luteitalea sp. TBR-22]|uniref:potassium channel family protein n=1 Tax=Luteitalea sp. TBR-22 TaxID=2802971 RepID=UPI001AF909AA|nr:TrkA family potassium uptake protein [Luteitalea sp. TBR-22]BCS36026.1 potassium transporter Trk [Luteitalea sp. TBR-22]